MTFAYPLLLWLLALVPLLWWWRPKSRASIAVPDLAQLRSRGYSPATINPSTWLRLLRSAALVALILALARPQNLRTLQQKLHSGVDIMLAVDISRSMAERDFLWQSRPVDRLTMVKLVLDQFITNRPTDRIGLVVFGSEAFLQSPLTVDHDVTRFLIDDLEIGQAGRNTALANALGVAIKRMKDLPAESKIIVLLTDGTDNASRVSPKEMAGIAAEQGIKVYTIAMGSVRALRQGGDRFGRGGSSVDMATLEGIAKTTGGEFFVADNSQALQDIYGKIDQLEKRQDEIASYTEIDELYYNYALAGFLLFALELLLSATILRVIPE